MGYKIQNDQLTVKVAATGAELESIVWNATGEEMLWQGDEAIWPRRAPLLFPHCGGLKDNALIARGKEFPSQRHGFARDMEFDLVYQKEDEVQLCLVSQEATRWRFPYEFGLTVTYTLEGSTLSQRVEVSNPLEEGTVPGIDLSLPFNVGFHPGFKLPLREGGVTEDCVVEFDTPQDLTVIETPEGLVSGKTHTYGEGCKAISLNDDMFAADSICFTGLTAETMTLSDREDERRFVKVDVAEFPYVLLWGPPSGPLPYVCIEPWHGLPDPVEGHGEFSRKPGIKCLGPGERFETTLRMEFSR